MNLVWIQAEMQTKSTLSSSYARRFPSVWATSCKRSTSFQRTSFGCLPSTPCRTGTFAVFKRCSNSKTSKQSTKANLKGKDRISRCCLERNEEEIHVWIMKLEGSVKRWWRFATGTPTSFQPWPRASSRCGNRTKSTRQWNIASTTSSIASTCPVSASACSSTSTVSYPNWTEFIGIDEKWFDFEFQLCCSAATPTTTAKSAASIPTATSRRWYETLSRTPNICAISTTWPRPNSTSTSTTVISLNFIEFHWISLDLKHLFLLNGLADKKPNTPIQIVYVPSHLYHILFELFKNSMRAVVEHHGSAARHYPSIQVLIIRGKEDVTIKVLPLLIRYLQLAVDYRAIDNWRIWNFLKFFLDIGSRRRYHALWNGFPLSLHVLDGAETVALRFRNGTSGR